MCVLRQLSFLDIQKDGHVNSEGYEKKSVHVVKNTLERGLDFNNKLVCWENKSIRRKNVSFHIIRKDLMLLLKLQI